MRGDDRSGGGSRVIMAAKHTVIQWIRWAGGLIFATKRDLVALMGGKIQFFEKQRDIRKNL